MQERLREAMELRGVDQTALAKGVGITQGAVSLILKGKTRKSKHLPDIARMLNVSVLWLMGHDEPMEIPTSQRVLLNPNELDLIDAYRLLPITQRKMVEDITESMLLTWLIETGLIDVKRDRLGSDPKIAKEVIDDLERRRDRRIEKLHSKRET